MPSPTSARLQILAAALLFSTGGAAIKATAFTGWQVAGLRSAVAGLFLLATLPAARRRWSLATLAVATCYAGTLILFVTANKLTTAALTIFLQSTAPLYLLLLGPWVLAEPLRARDLGFAAVLAGGLALCFAGRQAPLATAPNPGLGNLLALGSGVCWAATIAGLRWMEKRKLDGGAGAAGALVAGNLLAGLICLPFGWPISGAGVTDFAVVGYLGVVQIGVAYLFFYAGLRHLPALEVGLLVLLEPVANPLWAWLFAGEQPAVWTLAGGALILAATAARTAVEARRA